MRLGVDFGKGYLQPVWLEFCSVKKKKNFKKLNKNDAKGL